MRRPDALSALAAAALALGWIGAAGLALGQDATPKPADGWIGWPDSAATGRSYVQNASVRLTVAVDGVGPWGVYHATPEGREVCFIATATTSGPERVYLYINLWRDAPNGPEAMAYLDAFPDRAASANLETPSGAWGFFTEHRDFWWPRAGDQTPLIDALRGADHASLALVGPDGIALGRYEFNTDRASAALERALMICGLIS